MVLLSLDVVIVFGSQFVFGREYAFSDILYQTLKPILLKNNFSQATENSNQQCACVSAFSVRFSVNPRVDFNTFSMPAREETAEQTSFAKSRFERVLKRF